MSQTLDKTALLAEALRLGVPDVDETTSGPALQLAVATAQKFALGDGTPAAPAASPDQITPELREQLLAEGEARARAQLGGDPAATRKADQTAAQLAAVAAATARDQRIREVLRGEQVHARKCPVMTSDTGRVEAYGETRPARPAKGLPAEAVTVVACLECSGRIALPGDPTTHNLTI